MKAFTMDEVMAERERSGKLYLEFLREASLSVGVYTLPAGGADPQQPHTEDEVYYVVAGEAEITVAGETTAVGPGSIVFVAAGVEHRFHDIRRELTTLVFFAPAEGSQAG